MLDVRLSDDDSQVTLECAEYGDPVTHVWMPSGRAPDALFHELSDLIRSHQSLRVWVDTGRDWEGLEGAAWCEPVPLGRSSNLSVVRLCTPGIPTSGRIKDERPLAVTILVAPMVPETNCEVSGLREAVRALEPKLKAPALKGRLRLEVVWLDRTSLEDWLESLSPSKGVDLLLYLGHAQPDDANDGDVALPVLQGTSQYLRLTELRTRIEGHQGHPLPATFLAACNSSAAARCLQGAAGAGLSGEIAGRHYIALCTGFGAALADGDGFAPACQAAWREAAAAGWKGVVRVGLAVAEDRLLPTGEEAALHCFKQSVETTFAVLQGPGGSVNADDIYEELPLLVPRDASKRERERTTGSAASPHEGWTRWSRSPEGEFRRVPIDELLGTTGSVLLVADPGAGKTTLLRQTARRLLQKGILAIYVHLGRWEHGRSLLEAAGDQVQLQLHPDWDDVLSAPLIRAILQHRGELTLLLDGVDEASPGALATLAEAIARFVRSAPVSRMVIALRPSGDPAPILNRLEFPTPKRIHLAVFEPDQIEKVAARWLAVFGSEASAAELVQQGRSSSESWALAHNPLLLRGMCLLLAADRLQLPSNLRELVDDLVSTLLGRAVEQISTKTDLAPETIRNVLFAVSENLAGIMAELATGELELSLAPSSDLPPSFAWAEKQTHQSPAVLLEWLRASGILVPVGRERWCFVHRVFEEYFTGRYVAHVHGKTPDTLLRWVTQYAIAPDQETCRRELFEALRWAGAFLDPVCMKAFVDWLLAHDSVLFEGTILAARVLAMGDQDIFQRCAPIVDEHLETLFRMEPFQSYFRWGFGELQAYVQRWESSHPSPTPPWQNIVGWLGNEWVCQEAMKALSELGTREQASRIVECLRDKSQWVRRAAVEALARLGAREQAPCIVASLRDKSWLVRCAAVQALSELGAREQVPRIVECLRDENRWVWRAAAEALARLGAREQAPRIVESLRDEREWVGEAAVEALAKLGGREQASRIVELLRDERWWVCRAAVEALARLGAREQAPRIVECLGDRSDGVRKTAVKALAALAAREQAPRIVEWLRDEFFGVRGTAVKALAALGAREQAPCIAKCLRDEDDWVRGTAVKALAALGAREQASRIVECLRDENDWVRSMAVKALEDLGARAQAPSIVECLRDESEGVRSTAVQALGVLGAREQVPRIVESLGDDSYQVRRAALVALGALGACEQAPRIVESLGDDSDEVREAAAHAIVNLGSREHGPSIVEWLGDKRDGVRTCAVWTLAALGARAQAPGIVECLRDESEWVRVAAVRALSGLGAREQALRIVQCLRDQSDEVRRAAVEALSGLGAREQAPGIVKCLRDERAEVRRAAVLALAELGAREQAPCIVKCLRDESDEVCQEAVKALAKLGVREQASHLVECLRDQSDCVRKVAVRALADLGAREECSQIAERLRDESQWVREAAVTALGELGAREQAPRIVRCVRDQCDGVREAAVTALRSFGWIRET